MEIGTHLPLFEFYNNSDNYLVRKSYTSGIPYENIFPNTTASADQTVIADTAAYLFKR